MKHKASGAIFNMNAASNDSAAVTTVSTPLPFCGRHRSVCNRSSAELSKRIC